MRLRTLASAMGFLLLAATACSTDRPAGDDLGFWTALAFHAEWVEAYSSVTDMAAAADLVIVGTIDRVSAGREWGDPREAENRVASILFTVDVDEVLHGAMPDPTVDAVAWEHALPGYNLSHIQDSLTNGGLEDRTGTIHPFPTRRVLLFLRSANDLGSELTIAPEAVIVAGMPYRLVSVGGLVTETDAKAASPLLTDMDADSPAGRLLSEQIAASTFDEVVDLARGE